MGEMWKSAKKEFGKKAGKALGNAIFGVYGEDKRIGVRYEQGSAKRKGNSPQKEAITSSSKSHPIEKATNTSLKSAEDRAEKSARVHIQKMEAEVMAIEFDPSDPKQIVKQLTKLASIVELAMKNDDSDDDGIGIAAETHFATGLATLKSVSPKNSMIAHFDNMQAKWKSDRKKIKKAERSSLMLGLGLIFGGMLICLAMHFLISNGIL